MSSYPLQTPTSSGSVLAVIGFLLGYISVTGLLCQMAELKEAVNTLVEEYAKLDDGLEAYAEGVAQVAAGYSRISGGASELAGGSSELAEGGDSLYSGTLDLLDGLTQLYAATGDLSDGTGELREETSGMDSELEEKIDEILDSLSGGDGEPVSFVSDKNTNVASVQFAMQTKSIEVEEVEMEEETEAEPARAVREPDNRNAAKRVYPESSIRRGQCFYRTLCRLRVGTGRHPPDQHLYMRAICRQSIPKSRDLCFDFVIAFPFRFVIKRKNNDKHGADIKNQMRQNQIRILPVHENFRRKN